MCSWPDWFLTSQQPCEVVWLGDAICPLVILSSWLSFINRHLWTELHQITAGNVNIIQNHQNRRSKLTVVHFDSTKIMMQFQKSILVAPQKRLEKTWIVLEVSNAGHLLDRHWWHLPFSLLRTLMHSQRQKCSGCLKTESERHCLEETAFTLEVARISEVAQITRIIWCSA